MSKVIIGENDLLSCNPEMAKQWDYDKNNGMTPERIAVRSNKKVWWKCGLGHSFEMTPDHRSRGQNCPYCSGKQVLKGFNDLQTTVPDFVLDWDYSKNRDILPTSITVGSNKKVWWKCHVCGFEWNTSPNNRQYNSGKCPRCVEIQRVKNFRKSYIRQGENDLKSQGGVLLAEWDYEKNIGLDPADYTINSSEMVWWKCS